MADRDVTGDQLLRTLRLNDGPIQALGEAIHLRADAGDGVFDVRTPLVERRSGGLKHSHALVTLLLTLAEAHVLEVEDALLEVTDPVGEVPALVDGDDSGRVLAADVVLQRGEALVHGVIVLTPTRLRVGEAAVDAVAGGLELAAEVVELLVQFVEHVVDDWIHGSSRALEAGEVAVGGWDRLQHARRPEVDGFDTSVSSLGC
jgi:hypothetical protein